LDGTSDFEQVYATADFAAADVSAVTMRRQHAARETRPSDIMARNMLRASAAARLAQRHELVLRHAADTKENII